MRNDKRLKRLVTALRLPGVAESVLPGASVDELAETERRIGRPLPDDFRAFYREIGGGAFVGGNLNVNCLLADDEDVTVAGAADALRGWDWAIPDEVVIFGFSGGGDPFGVWLPRDDLHQHPLVVQCETGSDDQPLGAIVVGDDFVSFLTGWVAIHLGSCLDRSDGRTALKVLGVPRRLRKTILDDESGDEVFWTVMSWANPGLHALDSELERESMLPVDRIAQFASDPP